MTDAADGGAQPPTLGRHSVSSAWPCIPFRWRKAAQRPFQRGRPKPLLLAGNVYLNSSAATLSGTSGHTQGSPPPQASQT